MKDLLIALFAMSLLYLHRKPTKEIYAALKSPALKVFYKEIPGLKDTCDGFMRGEYDFEQLNDSLRKFNLRYKVMPTSRLQIANTLNGFAAWFRNDSLPGYAKIEKASASPAFPTWIQVGFIKDVGSQDSITKKLMRVVQRLGGPEGSVGFADNEQAAKAKAKNPEAYREYLELRKQYNEVWKAFMSNFVRKSGKPTVPYQDLLKAFREARISHGLPVGFKGNVDANGQWYTSTDRLVSPPPTAVMFPTVRMNPDYTDGDEQWYYQAISTDGAGGKYGYDRAATKKKVNEKFEKVKLLIEALPSMRRKWLKFVMNYDGSLSSVAAVVLEVMYQTKGRVGGSSKETYGVSSVQMRHFKLLPGGFQLHYPGKDEVDTKYVYKATDPVSKKIVAIVTQLAQGKTKNEQVFTFAVNGHKKNVTSAHINALWRATGAPSNVGVHKIRTAHGTAKFLELCEKVYAKYSTFKNPQESFKILMAMGEEVGKDLNHIRTTKDGSTKATGATALSAYIDHSAQVEFFEHYGMPLPRHLQSAHLEASKATVRIWASDGAGQQMQDKPAKKGDDVNKPQKPVMPDTKPTAKEEKKEKPETPNAEPDKPTASDEDGGEDDVGGPQSIGNLEVTQEDIDAIEDEKRQDKKDDKARAVLEKQAEKFGYLLTRGGDSGYGMFDDDDGPDNLLMTEVFKSGAP